MSKIKFIDTTKIEDLKFATVPVYQYYAELREQWGYKTYKYRRSKSGKEELNKIEQLEYLLNCCDDVVR